jgi:biopolymer transport protein ExbD
MAGSSSGGGDGKKKARIEIILLATFVLFTLSLNKSQGLSVSLPQSETGEARDPSGTATISVTQEGTIAWDKDPVTLDEFLTRLKAFRALHLEESKILINGDENAPFNQAIYVFDEVRKAGIQKVLIETRVKPAGS